MKKPKISLRTGMTTAIVLCWLAPILLLVTTFGILLGESYQRSARLETDDGAQLAMMQLQTELDGAVKDSKSVSYDGVIRNAYRGYRENGNKVFLYRSVNDYLRDNFSRSERYRAVFLIFWDEQINDVYAFGAGESGSALIQDCRAATPLLLETMRSEDTQTCFLLIDGQLYLARNLLDSHFDAYASIIMMLKPESLLAPLTYLGESSDVQLQLDGLCFGDSGRDSLEPRGELDGGYLYETQVDGHTLCLRVEEKEYNAWKENPSLGWAAAGAALLVFPLLLVLWLVWRKHVGKPVETLVEANLKVQSGDRGYAITGHAPNTEFDTLFEHFNDILVNRTRKRTPPPNPVEDTPGKWYHHTGGRGTTTNKMLFFCRGIIL